jgi:hypothetical protein
MMPPTDKMCIVGNKVPLAFLTNAYCGWGTSLLDMNVISVTVPSSWAM